MTGGNECVGLIDGVGVIGTVVADAVAVGDVVADAVAVGDGLIAWPTWAGGGKFSTGLPAIAPVIICCHVDAGSPPPYSA